MADKFLKVDIISPQSVVYSGDAISVGVPGSQSPFTVLINHSPIVSSLENGIIKIKNSDNKSIYFATTSGFIEVKQNVVSILVESALDSSKLDKSKIESEIGRLKSEIANVQNVTDKLQLETKLAFEYIKLKVVGL
jgi:F-type H+-transporting ATPase subunit epsilon